MTVVCSHAATKHYYHTLIDAVQCVYAFDARRFCFNFRSSIGREMASKRKSIPSKLPAEADCDKERIVTADGSGGGNGEPVAITLATSTRERVSKRCRSALC